MDYTEDSISLVDIIKIVRGKMWIIILITMVATITSGIISFFLLDSIYATSTTLMVSKTREEQTNSLQYNDILLNQKLVKTYSEIIQSDRVLDKVIDKMGLDEKTDDLRKKISVNSVADTEIIEITVEDKDPVFATELANSVAVVFMGEISSIMKMDNVQFIDPAKVPEVPVKPRKKLNIAIAGIIGLMASFGVVFLIEYMDNTIKTPDDIERYLGLPVLGSIPVFDE